MESSGGAFFLLYSEKQVMPNRNDATCQTTAHVKTGQPAIEGTDEPSKLKTLPHGLQDGVQEALHFSSDLVCHVTNRQESYMMDERRT